MNLTGPFRHLTLCTVMAVGVLVATASSTRASICGALEWSSAISQAEMVFQGRVTSRVVIPFLVNSTTFDVRRVWKGPVVSRIRIQRVPDPLMLTPILVDTRADYDDGDYVVFVNLTPAGFWDSLCVPVERVVDGIDPELKSLLGAGSVPRLSLGALLDIVPGWTVLALVCLLSSFGWLCWSLLSRARSRVEPGAVVAIVCGGAIGGALLMVTLAALQNFSELVRMLSSRHIVGAIQTLGLFGLLGAAYGFFLGASLAPGCSELICSQPRSRRRRACLMVGVGIGLLVGWSILGTLFPHVFLLVSILGGLLAGHLGYLIYNRSEREVSDRDFLAIGT